MFASKAFEFIVSVCLILVAGYLFYGLTAIAISMWFVSIPLGIVCIFQRKRIKKLIHSLFY